MACLETQNKISSDYKHTRCFESFGLNNYQNGFLRECACLIGFKENGNGRGTVPDITVVPTIEDLVEGRDKALQRVIDLIQKNKK